MSRRKSSHRKRLGASSNKGYKKRFIFATICLMLALAGGLLAQWRSLHSGSMSHNMLASAPLPAAPVSSPPALSKEYIYAGGRMIATEEFTQTLSPSPSPSPAPSNNTNDTIWIEDALPAGAATCSYNDAFNWTSANPAPFSGTQAFQTVVATGEHDLCFTNATATLTVNAGETLIAYVYLDPANTPGEIMLSWNDGNWGYRAYWGADLVNAGTNNTISRRYMGALPAAGQWVRLEVPASLVGLEGHTLSGLGLILVNGRAAWDHIGKSAQSSSTSSSRINVALAANGGTASASSNYAGYLPGNVIDGSRRAVNGALWLDSTMSSFPDWVEVDFSSNKTINEIDVITQQDDYNNPVEPTLSQTFSLYGITAFNLQYWNGSAWVNVPGGTVTGNTNVWRQFNFSPLSTNKIRLVVNACADNVFSRVVEVEAWGN